VTAMAEQACHICHGAQGHVETTWTSSGARIDTWRPCGTCNGSGEAR
jgi:DnaJ-class molecular chaperone